MIDVVWLKRQSILLLHERSIERHGGLRGLRDEGLLDSALARPINILNYEPNVSPARLAAAYAVGIARNHPFVDGNKRTAFAALGDFLKANGWNLDAAPDDATKTMLRVAAGEMSELELGAWIESRIQPRGSRS
jgi:death-on-curing protein